MNDIIIINILLKISIYNYNLLMDIYENYIILVIYYYSVKIRDLTGFSTIIIYVWLINKDLNKKINEYTKKGLFGDFSYNSH